MERQDIPMIDNYIVNNLLENTMNECETEYDVDALENIRNVIEDVMTRYIFDLADEDTKNAIVGEIAGEIEIDEYFDYLLEATIDQDGIIIDLCIKPHCSDDFTYFTASYSDCPAIQYNTPDIKKTTFEDFDRAMKSI